LLNNGEKWIYIRGKKKIKKKRFYEEYMRVSNNKKEKAIPLL